MSREGIYYADCVDFLKTLDDESIDLIVTDPPYGINYLSNKQLGNTRSGKTVTTRDKHYFDSLVGDDILPVSWLKDAYRVLKNNTAIYIFCRWDKFGELSIKVKEAEFKLKNMIVLNKSNHGMGDLKGAYANKHELILFATKGRHILNRVDGRPKDILDVSVKFSGSHRHHPTEKPISWITPFIKESSNPGDIVLDPFAGSGSTAVAATQLNRKYLLIENDAHYIDITKDRLNIK